MSAQSTAVTMSLQQFLLWEPEQERKFELVDGRPVMMTGGTNAHDEIRGAIYSSLRQQLSGQPCRAKIDIKVVCANGNARYPDVQVDCGPQRPGDTYATEPTVVIEVLSESSQTTDFFSKLRDYGTVPSVLTYLIFSQTHARVSVFRRIDGKLELEGEKVGLDLDINLPEVAAMLRLSDVYGGLSLPTPDLG